MFGQHLKRARKLQELTQEELAHKLFTTKQNISSYESDKTDCPLEVLMQLSEILNFELKIKKGSYEMIYEDVLKRKITARCYKHKKKNLANTLDMESLKKELVKKAEIKTFTVEDDLYINIFDLGWVENKLGYLEHQFSIYGNNHTIIDDLINDYCDTISKKKPNDIINLLNVAFKKEGVSFVIEKNNEDISIVDINNIKWEFAKIEHLGMILSSNMNIYSSELGNELDIKGIYNNIKILNNQYFLKVKFTKNVKEDFECIAKEGNRRNFGYLLMLNCLYEFVDTFFIDIKEYVDKETCSMLKEQVKDIVYGLSFVERTKIFKYYIVINHFFNDLISMEFDEQDYQIAAIYLFQEVLIALKFNLLKNKQYNITLCDMITLYGYDFIFLLKDYYEDYNKIKFQTINLDELKNLKQLITSKKEHLVVGFSNDMYLDITLSFFEKINPIFHKSLDYYIQELKNYDTRIYKKLKEQSY